MATIELRRDGILITRDNGKQELWDAFPFKDSGIKLTFDESALSGFAIAHKKCDVDSNNVQQRVARSIKVLDKCFPGWWYKLHFHNANINIGQNIFDDLLNIPFCGNRNLGYDRLGIKGGDIDQYAFTDEPRKELNEEWKRAIKKRRPEAFTD